MADLDAELLALAGGDSSGEEGYSSPQPPRRKSPSPHRKQYRSPARDMGNKGTAKAVKKPRRRRDDYDEDR
jgi:hypothetical protein